MQLPERLELNLEFEMLEPSPWWKDGRVGRLLADSLAATGLWLDFRFYGVDGASTLAKTASPDDLARQSLKWKPRGYILVREKEHAAGWEQLLRPNLALTVRLGLFHVLLRASDDALASRKKTILQSMCELGVRMQQGLRSIATLNLGTVGIDEPYPRCRPPRRRVAFLSPGSLIDFYDLAHIRRHAMAWSAHQKEAEQRGDDDTAIPSYVSGAFDVVTRAKLPSGIKRELHDDLVVIRWARDVVDPAKVMAARVGQEQWLISHLELEIDDGFNEAGDQREEPAELQSHPQLTWYRTAIVYDDEGELADVNIGYKAVVATAAGDLEKAQWKQYSSWAKGAPLSNKLVLHELRLIAPTRKLALALWAKAQPHGITAVLYPDREKQWWNPAPPGMWFERRE